MNNKCVYVHKLNGEVVYVGSGTLKRIKNKHLRSEDHLSVWSDLVFEIVRDNLTIDEALEIEQLLINQYWESGKLFNRERFVYKVKQLNIDELSKYFYYDETSPTYLRWKVSISSKIKTDSPAGRSSKLGYVVVGLNGNTYYVHRIIWVLINKKDIPKDLVIDHINGERSDNIISNLRIVARTINNKNRTHRLTNTGYQGISQKYSSKLFTVSFTSLKQVHTIFSYANTPTKASKNHYPTRELAFEAALAYRNSLVEQGLIILTNKEETNGIN